MSGRSGLDKAEHEEGFPSRHKGAERRLSVSHQMFEACGETTTAESRRAGHCLLLCYNWYFDSCRDSQCGQCHLLGSASLLRAAGAGDRSAIVRWYSDFFDLSDVFGISARGLRPDGMVRLLSAWCIVTTDTPTATKKIGGEYHQETRTSWDLAYLIANSLKRIPVLFQQLRKKRKKHNNPQGYQKKNTKNGLVANRCHQFLYFFLIPPGLAVTTGEAISSQFYGSVSLSGSDPRLVSCEWVPMSLVMNISYGHSCWVIQDLVPTSCYGMLCIARSTILNWSFTWASLQSYLWRLRRILQLPLGATQSRVQHNLSSFKHPRYLPEVCWRFRYLLSLGNLKWFEKEKTEWILIKDF